MTRFQVLLATTLVFQLAPGILVSRVLSPTWRIRMGSLMAIGLLSSLSTLLVGLALPEALAATSFEQLLSLCSQSFAEIFSRPTENLLAISAGVLLVAIYLRLSWSLLQSYLGTREARVRGEADWISPRGHPVSVLRATRMGAYSVPGPAGQIVLTTALLSGLEPEEVDAVLLHESAHIELHHHRVLRLVRAVGSALAFVPSVTWLVRGLEQAIEEDADEFTVVTSQAPLALAGALSATALAGLRGEGAMVGLGGGHDIARRVHRILEPPDPSRWVGPIGASIVVGLSAAVVASNVSAAYAVAAMGRHIVGLGTATMCSLNL